PPPRRRPGKGRRLWLWGILGFLVAAGLWGALLVWGFLPASPPELAPRRVHIVTDDRQAVVAALADAGLVDAPGLMLAYVTLVQRRAPVVAREHWVGGGRTPRQLLALLSERSGEVSAVALPEGRTSFELAERLERAGVCSGEAFLAAARDASLLGEFGVPGDSAEGYLFPETYQLRKDERPERVLRRFLREGQKRQRTLFERWPLLDEHRALGLGEREVVILASIVERETGHTDERARIARVFLNRLATPRGETGGRLESDPTALYGCRVLGAAAPPTCSFDG